MKKFISLLLVLVMCCSLFACGDSGSSGNNSASGPSDEELASAVRGIKRAEEKIIQMAAHQLDGWTQYASIMEYYFVDEKYKDATGVPSIASRASNIHLLRMQAQSELEFAKSIIQTTGNGDYYNAVKKYYLEVNNFFVLVSTFPNGYSKLTFSSSVSDYKAKCQNAYSEAAFFS